MTDPAPASSPSRSSESGRSLSSAEDRIAALLAYCDEIDAKAKAAWEDYSRWIEGRAGGSVPQGVPTLNTTVIREFLSAPARVQTDASASEVHS